MRLTFPFLMLACLSASCARTSSVSPQNELKPPLEIEIPQAFTQNQKLYVRTSLRPLVNLKANEVAVGVVGVGETPSESFRLLSDASGKQIAVAGERILADFEIPATGLTEYQVVLKWGEDAKSKASELSPTAHVPLVEDPPAAPETELPAKPLSGKVSIENLTLHQTRAECISPPCDNLCSFQGELLNGLQSKLSKVSLALGVTFIPVGAQLIHPADLAPLGADEEEVILDNLSLESGARRAIEVKLSEPLAEIPEGTFVPYLRLLRVAD